MPDYTDLTHDATTIARDAAYVVVGLGVLGLQKVQVQRVGLTNKFDQDLNIDDRIADLRRALSAGLRHADALVEQAFNFVETSLEPIEEQLPQSARDLAHKARTQAREVHSQIRDAVVPAA